MFANRKFISIQLQSGFSVPTQNTSFDHRPFIGNIGVSVDPVKLLNKKSSGKMGTSQIVADLEPQ